MLNFIGTIQIANGEFKTIRELIQVAIQARDYATATGKADAKSRINPAIAAEGFITPSDNLYMLDSFKAVVNGIATQAGWAAGDFTAVPGGGVLLLASISRHFDRGTDLSTRVLYNGTEASVTIECDITIF